MKPPDIPIVKDVVLIGAGHVVRYCKALRKSAIAIGASTGRFLVDASTLIRLSYPIWRRAAKNGA